MENPQTIPVKVAPLMVKKQRFDLGQLTIIAITGMLFLVLSLCSDTFFSYNNIYSILYGTSIQFFAVIGFTLLMIMGEIDLSVGSMYAFSGMLAGYLVKMKVPVLAAVLIALLACTLVGALTGLLVVKLRLNSMMVTIATMTLMRGLASALVKKLYGHTYSSEFRHLAKFSIGNVYITIIIMIVLVVGLEYLMKRSSIFKKMYFVGENIDTARIYGIKAERIKIATFALSALTAAIGGVLIASRVTYADTAIGVGLEFQMLTAAVLGGASLYGGKGSILRSAVGLIFLATLLNGMVIFNIEPLLQQLIIGVILIVSVFIDTRMNKMNKA